MNVPILIEATEIIITIILVNSVGKYEINITFMPVIVLYPII